MKFVKFSLAFGAVVAAGVASAAWNWKMPQSVYGELEFTSRAAVDKATKAFDEVDSKLRLRHQVPDLVNRCRMAAAEWRKVQVQGEAEGADESLIAYAIFMQGYCLETGKDRNKAMGHYNEVIDLYADQGWIVAPARFCLARTFVETGDIRKGDAALDALLADPACAEEAIVADALVLRAQRYRVAGKYADELECLKRAVSNDAWRKENKSTWEAGRDALLSAAAVHKRPDLITLAALGHVENDPVKRLKEVREVLDWYEMASHIQSAGPEHWYIEQTPANANEAAKFRSAWRETFAKWVDSQRPVYAAAGQKAEGDVAAFRASCAFEKPEALRKRANDMLAGVNAEKDAKRREKWKTEIATSLMGAGVYDSAKQFADGVEDPICAAWLRYQTDNAAGQWKAAASDLDEVIAQSGEKNPQMKLQAQYALVYLYRERIRDAAKALSVASQISDQPRSLWELAKCQRAAGQKKPAQATLTEIASIFADQAPDAVLQQADWYAADGDQKKAVALYRRLLTQPEWKKSGASSKAHQRLESLGMKTGGAVAN